MIRVSNGDDYVESDHEQQLRLTLLHDSNM